MRRVVLAISALLLAIVSAGAATEGKVPLKTFLHGRLESMKGRRVVVVYDFRSELQLLDFESVNPFLVRASGDWRIEDGKLTVSGSSAFRWKPVLEADLRIRYKATLRDGRDAGVVLVEPGLTSRCILFALGDTFFSTKDRQRTLAHMITCCGVDEAGSGGENVFRYVDRSWIPVLVPGKEVQVELAKRGERNHMVIGETVLQGGDIGIRMPRVQAALCVIGVAASWSELRIEALLDPEWLRANDIQWDAGEDSELEKPADEPADEPAAEPPGADELAQVLGWLRVVGDVQATKRDREQAARKIIDRKRIMDVPPVVRSGILYSADETSRELGYEMLKAITGKTLGYSPRLDSEKRRDAVGRWWAWITANRAKIDRDEEKGGER